MRNVVCFLLMLLLLNVSLSQGADWNQFRGPNRDGKSSETGLLKEWAEGGPPLLWSYGDLEHGYASVSVMDGTIYTTGMNEENQGILYVIDNKGKLQWKREYGPEWTDPYPGTRTTPTIDEDRIYLMSGQGRLSCFSLKTEHLLWKVDTLEKVQGENITWGISESVIIDGNKVICTPGGQDATLVAVDKHTGKTIWTTEGLSNLSAYCSPTIAEHAGKHLLFTMVRKLFVCLNIQNGKVLWTIPHETSNNIAAISPIYDNGHIYFTSHKTGGTVIELLQDGNSYSEVWTNPELDALHGGVIYYNDHLYGSDTKGRWICQNFMSGKIIFAEKILNAKGSLIYADGMLYCYSEKGTLGLVNITQEGIKLISSFNITQGTKEHWAHPVISDGRLYVRHGNALMAYDIKEK